MKITINYEGNKMPSWEILSNVGFNAEEGTFDGKIWSENSREQGSYTIEIEDVNQEDWGRNETD